MNKRFYILIGSVCSAIVVISYFLCGLGSMFTLVPIVVGICLLCLITMLSFWFSIRNITHQNPHKFVNGVMVATFSKLMLCVLAVGIWLFLNKSNLHKPDLFYLMFVYLIFAVCEAVFLSKISKK